MSSWILPLADLLGDLPLALDLAGRFLEDRSDLSIEGYLAELKKAGSALEHTSLKDWVRHHPTGHTTSLAATFMLSWQQLAEGDESARRLFRSQGTIHGIYPYLRSIQPKRQLWMCRIRSSIRRYASWIAWGLSDPVNRPEDAQSSG